MVAGFEGRREYRLAHLREDGEGTGLHLAAKPAQGTTRKRLRVIVRVYCLVVLFTT